MPQNRIPLEIDLNTDDLTKETVRAKRELESITVQVRSLQKSLKDNEAEQRRVAKEMANLSKSGQENTQRFRDLQKASENLKQSEATRRVELEKQIASQKISRSEYSNLSKTLSAYTSAAQKELTINKAKGGSIQQIQNALNQNRLAYKNLSQEERNNVEIGGELLKTINQQDQELKSLSDAIGLHQLRVGDYRNQIQLAVEDLKNKEEKLRDLKKEQDENRVIIENLEKEQKKLNDTGEEGSDIYSENADTINRIIEVQDRLNTSIAQTEQEIKETNEELKNNKEALQESEQESINLGLEQVNFTGRLGNVIKGFFTLRKTLPLTARAVKAFGRTLLANPIYLLAAIIAGVIAAMVGLVSIFSRTQKAQDGLKRATAGIRGAFQAMIGILQKLGGFLVSVFSQPQKILKAYLFVVKQVFNFYKNILTLNFKGLGEQFKGLANGARNLFRRVKEVGQEATASIREGIQAGNEIANNEIRLRDLRTENLTKLAQLKNALEEQNTIVNNVGLSEEERLAAADEQARLAREINKLKGDELDLEISILETKFSLNDTSAEELEQLEQLRARRIALDGEETRTIRSGEKQRTKIINDEQRKREQRNQQRLDKQRQQEQIYNSQSKSIQDKIRDIEDEATLKELETQEERDIFRLNRELERIQEGIKALDITEDQKTKLILESEKFRQASLDTIQQQAIERREQRTLEQEQRRLEQEEGQRLVDQEQQQIELEKRLSDEERFQNDRIRLIEGTSAIFGDVLGEESKVFQAVSLAKRAFIIADQIAQAKAAIADATRAAGKATQTGAQAVADAQAGALETGKSAPFPFNLGLIAGYFATVLPIVANVIGAVRQAKQFATAQKQASQPRFEKGGVIPIGGKRHSQGGTQFYGDDGSTFEAERGEAIVLNRGATRKFIPYLSQLNKQYGGVDLMNKSSFLQSGGTISSRPFFDTDELANKIGVVVVDGVRRLPNPVVSVEDINTSQTNVSVLESRANL